MEGEMKPEGDTGGTSSLKQQNPLSVPAAIIVAGLIVALAILYSNGGGGTAPAPQAGAPTGGTNPTAPSADTSKISLRAVSATEHVFGDPNAPVKIVEYSDLECPFCKNFHPTLKQVVTDYQGKVAWVYRHFPLDSIHPKARKEAEASECANELGGNTKFWAYIDRLYEITPSNNGLDLAKLPEIAAYVGLDKAKFESCLASGKYASYIETDLQDAIAAGGRGTPYAVVISSKGNTYPVNGALSLAQVKSIVDQALAN